MSSIVLHGKNFDTYLSEEEIQKKVKEIAEQLNRDYKGKRPPLHCNSEWILHVRG